ncbi:hypothetical protein [Rhizobium rhizogenes]|uniref:hypothetical protein n=1 Tax=Rhizobium rhizogenes TaxID=359 RepID=UPI001572E90B|nr:hypothetical protein [Rhizobium rhizogenes]NTF83929.1 hypothetical protein [Rhizobium rhizogenes]
MQFPHIKMECLFLLDLGFIFADNGIATVQIPLNILSQAADGSQSACEILIESYPQYFELSDSPAELSKQLARVI